MCQPWRARITVELMPVNAGADRAYKEISLQSTGGFFEGKQYDTHHLSKQVQVVKPESPTAESSLHAITASD